MNYPTLYLLHPDHLPRSRTEINENLSADLRHELVRCARTCSSASNDQMLALVQHMLDTVRLTSVAPAALDSSEAASNSEHDEHDRFFNIVRVAGNPLYVFAHTLLQAYGELLENALVVGIGITPLAWARLRSAFDVILADLAAEHDSPAIDLHRYASPPARRARGEYDPMLRWRLGHHVFMALIQSLIVTAGCFRTAVATGDTTAGEQALEHLVMLMWGSASALQFAADFHPDEYEEMVRPAMMPPHLNPGFSGLMSRDHHCLMQELAHLRSTFEELPSRLLPYFQQFAQALASTYDTHKLVCARFRGGEVPSLRMNPASKKTAVDVLDGIKRARLRLVEL